MKNLILLILFVSMPSLFGQISTTRMNDIYLQSTIPQVEKIVGHQLDFYESLGYAKEVKVEHKGASFDLSFTEIYSQTSGDLYWGLSSISTTSKNIKTLSKMGVGNTYDDLLKTYRNFSDFSVTDGWDEETGEINKNKRIFSLNDEGNILIFYLKNEVVYKISLFINEGC